MNGKEPVICKFCGKQYDHKTKKNVLEAHFINKHKKLYLDELKKIKVDTK